MVERSTLRNPLLSNDPFILSKVIKHAENWSVLIGLVFQNFGYLGQCISRLQLVR